MILSAMLFILAVICYSIKELKSFGKLKWMGKKKPYGFWGAHSDKRKYKYSDTGEKEPAFLFADTWLVFVTDGFHLMQFFFKILFCAAFYPLTNWWFPFVLWLLWTIVWNLCDRYLTK